MRSTLREGLHGLSPRTVRLLWVLSRLVVLGLLFGAESRVVGDVVYFTHSLRDVSTVGLAHTMPEYPLPAVGVVAIPWFVARLLGGVGLYGFLFATVMLALDGLYTVVLSRSTGSGRSAALAAWLVAIPALGALSYARFDLLPGVLVGCALLTAGTRPRAGAILLGVATSIKLWPVLLVPPVLAATRRRGRFIGAFALVGLIAAGGTVVATGWHRLVSPLVYQADRGVQIESLAGTPAMLGWMVHPSGWTIDYTHFKAYEIAGPGVAAAAVISTVLTVIAVGWLGVVSNRALRAQHRIPVDVLVWLALAAVTGFVCVGKVFSPQYLLWLLPAAAAGLSVVPAPARSRLARWTAVLTAAALLSHLEFPWLYIGLVEHSSMSWIAVVLLGVRNLLVLWLFAQAVRQTLLGLRREVPQKRRELPTSEEFSAS